MSGSRKVLVALLPLSLVCACAGASKDPAGAPATMTTTAQPPELLRGARPELRVPASTSTRATVRIELEVMVDESGRPDMRTFEAVGPGADLNGDALRTWIEGASFRPARLDGHAVPGLFKMRLEASARRM